MARLSELVHNDDKGRYVSVSISKTSVKEKHVNLNIRYLITNSDLILDLDLFIYDNDMNLLDIIVINRDNIN